MFGILRKNYKWAWMTHVRGNMAKEPLSYFYYQRPIDHRPKIVLISKLVLRGVAAHHTKQV
ncbi:MAG: hypothetical protein JRJ43_08405 [Deltaproteobacteria bacterium]|nr:hypothetical protein [Deltaproteobacteria bacterium]